MQFLPQLKQWVSLRETDERDAKMARLLFFPKFKCFIESFVVNICLLNIALLYYISSIRYHFTIFDNKYHKIKKDNNMFKTLIKGNMRKKYGSKVSLEMSRGNFVKYKNKLVYLGRTSSGRVSDYSMLTGERFSQNIKKENFIILYNNKLRTQFLLFQ